MCVVIWLAGVVHKYTFNKCCFIAGYSCGSAVSPVQGVSCVPQKGIRNSDIIFTVTSSYF